MTRPRFSLLRFGCALCGFVLAHDAGAQSADSTRRAPGATVSGMVRDSIAHVPLSGAIVQLVTADTLATFSRTVTSDSLGRFALDDVPDGRYTLGFFHPMLDSLGVAPFLRDVSVVRHRAVHADLAIPSAARLRAAICGASAAADSGGVVIGVVRGAHDRQPIAGVSVSAEWLELSFGIGGILRRRPHVSVKTTDQGWFALCNVPSGGTMFMQASRDADSTGLMEVNVPREGFLRNELYLGASRTVVLRDTALRTDSSAVVSRVQYLGDGRLSGTVFASDGNRPLPGAQVRIANGPVTHANVQGAWTLVDAPLGTRVLEVHAVGFYPEQRTVDVVDGAAPIRVGLSTLKAVLDTVKVRASRVSDGGSGFQERRRSGVGHYLTPEDVVRQGAILTSDLFRSMNGVRMEMARDDVDAETMFADTLAMPRRRILMRGMGEKLCAPSIYIDGAYAPHLGADDVDLFVSVKRIRGVEVYQASQVPMAFQRSMTGCGVILIWTR